MDTKTLSERIEALGWQGGTIHQVEEAEKALKVYTENEAIESLFNKNNTLTNEGIEITKSNKNIVYFTYKQKALCLNSNGVILKYSIIDGKRYFQHGVLEFETYKEYNKVLDTLKEYLNKNEKNG
jgi:hypothetical protein